MEIRQLTESECEQIWELVKEIKLPYSLEIARRILRETAFWASRGAVFAVFENSVPMGFVAVQRQETLRGAEAFIWLARCRHGSASILLMERIENWCRSMNLNRLSTQYLGKRLKGLHRRWGLTPQSTYCVKKLW